MNRDAEAAALTCGSLFLQQFRFFLDHCQKYQRFFSATGNGMAAAVLAERRHARLHRICFVIILIYSLPGQNVIHFRLAVMLMVSHYYENRDNPDRQVYVTMRVAFENLLYPYRDPAKMF